VKRQSGDASEPDLGTQLREAFTTTDPEAAWYFDRVMERVVRVSKGVTSIPDLPAEEVEEDEHRYAEIPAITESEIHLWMEEFVDAHPDPKVAALLDERHGANERFLAKLAAANPEAFEQWKTFHAARVDETVAAWREL
jgi:Uncharacterised protein family (UPF0158)